MGHLGGHLALSEALLEPSWAKKDPLTPRGGARPDPRRGGGRYIREVGNGNALDHLRPKGLVGFQCSATGASRPAGSEEDLEVAGFGVNIEIGGRGAPPGRGKNLRSISTRDVGSQGREDNRASRVAAWAGELPFSKVVSREREDRRASRIAGRDAQSWAT